MIGGDRTFTDGTVWKTWMMGMLRMVWCEHHGTIAAIDSRAWSQEICDAIIAKHNESHEELPQ